MFKDERRDALLVAAAKFMQLEHERSVTDDRMSMAADAFDLEARLYVEEIGPREVEPPERMYGQASVKGAEEEE